MLKKTNTTEAILWIMVMGYSLACGYKLISNSYRLGMNNKINGSNLLDLVFISG